MCTCTPRSLLVSHVQSGIKVSFTRVGLCQWCTSLYNSSVFVHVGVILYCRSIFLFYKQNCDQILNIFLISSSFFRSLLYVVSSCNPLLAM